MKNILPYVLGGIICIIVLSSFFLFPQKNVYEIMFDTSDDLAIDSEIQNTYVKNNNLYIEYDNPKNEVVEIRGLTKDRYLIEKDIILIYNFDEKTDYFEVHIGASSDIYTFGSENWIIDNELVYTNDTNVYLSAEPHTLSSSGFVYFNLTSKLYSGYIDAVWGFNTEIVKPKKAELYSPHNVSWNTSHNFFMENVTNIELSDEQCEIGNEYNTFKRNTTYLELIGWDNSTNETNSTPIYNTTSKIVCFDSYEQNGNNYTIFWHTKHTKLQNWIDISDKFDSVSYEFGGMNKWHYLKNVSIQAEQNYQVRIYIDIPISIEGSAGKYWWAIKPSSETISEAIDLGHFYYLDPWWNSSWGYRKEINISNTAGNLTDYQVKINENLSSEYSAGKINLTCKDIRFTNSTDDEIDYWIESCNFTANDNAIFWVEVPFLENATNTTIYMYYGNDDVSSISNLTNVFGTKTDAFWTFTGNANDVWGSRDCTVEGATLTTDRFGASNSAYLFDGVNDYLSCGSGQGYLLGQKTVIVWSKSSANPSSQALVITRYALSGWSIWHSVVDLQVYRLRHLGGTHPYIETPSYNDGNWHNTIGTVNSTYYARLYVDGVEKNQSQFTVAADSASSILGIGARKYTAWENFFNGTIDDVRIYNDELSASELASIYANPEPTYTIGSEETGVVIYFSITTHTPANNTLTNDNTTDYNFTVSGSESSYNCTLYLNDTSKGNNASTSNNTATIITSSAVSDGIYNWYVNCTANSTTNQSEIRQITIDTTPPSINWTQLPDLNLTDEDNPTYLFNITDNLAGVNASTVIFYHGLNETSTGNMNWSYRYPASAKQPDRLRNDNRNESIQLIEDNAIKLYTGDIGSYGGHLYGVCEQPHIEDSGIGWILFNETHNYHHLMSYHIPVDRTDLHSEYKADQYINVYKNHPAIIELHTFPTGANRTVHLELNIDDRNSTTPLLFYFCNSTVSPYTVDYTTDANCGFLGTKTDFDTKYKISMNSSYVHIHTGINGAGLLQVNGGIKPTDKMYLYLTTETPIVADAYKLYFANNTVADNTNFNETYYLHTYSPPSWTNRSETPDTQFQESTDNFDIQIYVHACDNATNCINFTIQTDALGDRPNVPPTTPYLIQPLNGSIISGIYNITWLDGSDPENDPFNISILLINGSDGSTIKTLANNTITNGTEYFEWNTFVEENLDYYQIYIFACDNSSDCSENDTSEGNFTIYNAPPNPPNPTISPVTLYTNTSANCTATFSDNDTAVGNLTFRWYVDSVSVYNQTRTDVPNGSTNWSLLSYGNFSKDEVINCTVIASDGYLNTTGFVVKTVQNTPPYATLNYPPDNSTGIELNPYLNITYYDIDGDNGNVSFYYGTNYNFEYTNISYSLSGGATYPTGIFKDGDYWYISSSTNEKVFKYYSNLTYTGTSYDVSSEDDSPQGIFKDGDYWYMVGNENDYVYKYYSNWTYTGTSYDIDIGGIFNFPQGIFKYDDYWYISEIYNEKKIFRYYSNWTYTGTSYDVSSEGEVPRGMYNDNHYWYVVNNETIYQYYLNWTYIGISYNISSEDNAPRDIFLDGDYWYIAGRENHKIYLYNYGMLLATETNITNGSYATYHWENLEQNTTYDWFVVSTDGTDNTTSDVWNFSTNNQPSIPNITFQPHSPIINDTIIANATSTDPEGDNLTYYYRYYDNNTDTNLTSWTTNGNYTINLSTYEGHTWLIFAYANDGELNSTVNNVSLIITNITIILPEQDSIVIGHNVSSSFNLSVNNNLTCYEVYDNTTYNLSTLSSGVHNYTRYLDFGNHTYEIYCSSLQNSSRNYSKSISNFMNTFAIWNVSLWNENDWNVAFNVSKVDNGVNLLIYCEGGSQYYYYNVSQVTTDVMPLCEAEFISANLEYTASSYFRSISVFDINTTGDLKIYLVDAYEYTVLEIPLRIINPDYYDAQIILYKQGMVGEETVTYIITEGYFDVLRIFPTYLAKDNRYLLRIISDGETRDIGWLHATSAGEQTLDVVEISFVPSVNLFQDKITLGANYNNTTNIIQITYEDLTNLTQNITFKVYNNTGLWFEQTYNSSNLTITLNDVPVNQTWYISYSLIHPIYGNSPIKGSITLIGTMLMPLLIGAWLYPMIAFAIIFFASTIITPRNILGGIISVMVMIFLFYYIKWLTIRPDAIVLLSIILIIGIILHLRAKGTAI